MRDLPLLAAVVGSIALAGCTLAGCTASGSGGATPSGSPPGGSPVAGSTPPASAGSGLVASPVGPGPSGSRPPASIPTGRVTLEVRPLIAPPAPVRCSSGCSGDPFARLARAGAEVPTTAAGFAKLAPARQRQLVAALGRADCATSGRQHGPYLIACDRGQTTGARLAFLLGDPVIVADDVRSAVATAPNTSLGQTEWVVQLRLTPPGTNAFAEWTAAHNTGGRSPSGAVTSCAPTGTPCDDYLAIVVDGRVLSTPYTVTAIRAGAVQISGELTRQSATRLAAGLS